MKKIAYYFDTNNIIKTNEMENICLKTNLINNIFA